MSKIFFEPWVGENYSDGFLGKRIMALGHVHVCGGCNECGILTNRDEECKFFTISVVKNYLRWRETGEYPTPEYRGWLRTFLNFTKAMVGYEPDYDEEENLWQSIIFYNYVQTSVSEYSNRPSEEAYQQAQEPFMEVVSKYEPDIIIAWGNGAYDFTPDTGCSCDPIVYEDIMAARYVYDLQSGKKCTMIKIHHPCQYFSYNKWHEIIKILLNN